MNKKFLILILIICMIFSSIPFACYANENKIYVSFTNGSDTNSGTKAKPLQSIDRARSLMNEDDTIVLLSGVYNKKLVFVNNGGSEEKPLKIEGEEGGRVLFTAYDPISSNWEKYKDNIYRTYIGKYDDIPHALINNNGEFENLMEARWPNAPADDFLNMNRAIMDEGSDHYTITDDALPQGDWTGATAYLWTGYEYEQYLSYARVIKEYTPGKNLKFDYVGEESVTYTPMKGDWYYLTNSLAGLDVAKEYYYDKNTGYFYIIMPDNQAPDKNEVHIRTRNSGAEYWSGSNIHLKNIDFYGGFIVQDSHNNVFDDVNIYYGDFFRTNDGYNSHVNAYNTTRFHNSNNNVWKNSEIAYTYSSGLLINGDNNKVINCDIHDVNYGGGYNACISIEGGADSTLISHNNLYKSGRFLIYFINTGDPGDGYDNTIIKYNDCHNAMYLTRDGGAIYGYHRNGKGVVIKNNWVHDSNKSCGIYLDNECTNFVVRNNVVWNFNESGIVINCSSINNTIYRNTVFDCYEGIQGWPKTEGFSQKGTLIANNAINPTADFITGSNAPTLVTNAFKTDFKIDGDFVPIEGSPLIDKGTKIDNIEDVFEGTSPDIGAYEYGGDYWIPGTFDKTLSGDVNFDKQVTLLDVLYLIKRLVKEKVTVDPVAADVNGNGKLDVTDLLFLRKYLAKYDIELYQKHV